MKPIMKVLIFIILSGVLVFISCKKESSCDNCGDRNKPPIANAGPDQNFSMAIDSFILNGSASLDPDGWIVKYKWIQVSGPTALTIVNDTTVITSVKNLDSGKIAKGAYEFELQVTDNHNNRSTDRVIVLTDTSLQSPPPPPVFACGNRPMINAQLVPIGSLSVARSYLVDASVGNKILFAGGSTSYDYSSRVDIYDTTTNTWSTAELSQAERQGMAVTTVGNKVLFAGGGNNDIGTVTSRVDIYDASSNTWSTTELSESREYLAAATLGDKVFFAGGGKWGPLPCGNLPSGWPPNANYYVGSYMVDIYDNTTNTWTTANLSEGRFELAATTVGNKVYFSGGLQSIFCGSKRIDIYDNTTNTWSTDQLNEVKASHAGVTIGNKIFWAAGANTPYWNGYNLSSQVEIKDLATGTSTFDCITPKAQFATVRKDDNIIFFTSWFSNPSNNKFDIYNITTNTWSIGILPVNINGASIISVNNTIYIAGGNVNGVYSNQVWKLEF